MSVDRESYRLEALCLTAFFVFAFAGCQVKNDRPIVVPRTQNHRTGYVQELDAKMKAAQRELDALEAERFKLIQSAESSPAKRKDAKRLARLKEIEADRLVKREQIDRFQGELEAENARMRGNEVYVEYGKYFPATAGAVFDFRDFRIEISSGGDQIRVRGRDGSTASRNIVKNTSWSFDQGSRPFRVEFLPGQIAVFSME